MPGDDSPDPDLSSASTISTKNHEKIWCYLRQSGPQNIRAFLHYLLTDILTLDDGFLREWGLTKTTLKNQKYYLIV